MTAMNDDAKPDDDARAHVPCDWPGCKVTGDPWEDKGWCFWFRYYLWLPEGFYCPEHNAFTEEGHRTGYFKDWPLDLSPEVLRDQEMREGLVPLDSEEGQRIMTDLEAEARRASFRVVGKEGSA
jgi:hypothetical protein